MRVELGDLGFDEGGALLLKRALREATPGDDIQVTGDAPDLDLHLRTWCRSEGHEFRAADGGSQRTIRCGTAAVSKLVGAERAGSADPTTLDGVKENPPLKWGLAARGALVDSTSPEFNFRLVNKVEVWSLDAVRIYAQASASQWDPATAIPWNADIDLPPEIEDAIVQVMTYLIENETAALIVPSRFIAQLHPHFREVMQVLAIQAADEARHIEVFTRRARLKRTQLGLSTSGGQASLKTLVDEPDFAIAAFLLSVLGEGTFLSLLWFLERHAPDPITAAVCRLAAQDEARHVAFGMAHLREHIAREPGVCAQLATAVHRRHDALQHTAGLNAEVFDALVLIAAGSWNRSDLRCGYQQVMQLTHEMYEARRKRIAHLGFTDVAAQELAALHTRNFM